MEPQTVDIIVYVVAGIPVAGIFAYTVYQFAKGLVNHLAEARMESAEGNNE